LLVVSSGLGVTERVALRAVRRLTDRGEPATRRRVASWVFGPVSGEDQIAPLMPPTRAQMSSFHRAVRSLEKKGLLREMQWTNVLEVTASGY
jgi:hypothetical protein